MPFNYLVKIGYSTPLATYRCRWANNIKIAHEETGHEGKDTVVLVQAMEACGEEKKRLRAFFTSALDGDELSASKPGRLNPRERAPWLERNSRLGETYSRSVDLKESPGHAGRPPVA